MKRRARGPRPDALSIAARLRLQPASDAAGEAAFLTARALGIANDLRSWNKTVGSQEYAGSTWTTHSPGLTDDEKFRWRLIAAAGGL